LARSFSLSSASAFRCRSRSALSALRHSCTMLHKATQPIRR
jgi:hypothetical protein